MTDPNVDMLAEAREAQWSALAFMGEDAIKVVSPAKVNLFLGVGPRRADGYHDVQTVMHALALHDVLFMTCRASSGDADAYAGPAGRIAVKIDLADKTQFLGAPGSGTDMNSAIDVKDNLVFKAIDALAREIGRSVDETVDVRIEKHIPMKAGLGGGSADAAAALVGLAHFWGVADSGETLRKVAASLGSDVPFFLEGGCGFFTGKGDAFERRLDPMKHSVVVVKPEGGVSTAEAYAAFDASPVAVPAELLAEVENASCAEEVPLFNNLEPAAESVLPQLAEVREWLCAQEGVARSYSFEGSQPGEESGPGCEPKVLLSGSGSAIFAICRSYDDAARITAAACSRGWWARATSFSSLRALKV